MRIVSRKDPGVSFRLHERLTLWATRRVWNRVVCRVLCQAKEAGLITSGQLHELAKEFDPTQDGLVGRLPAEPSHATFLLRRTAALLLLLAIAAPAAAQAAPDPCQVVTPGSTFVVTSTSAPWISWVHDALVPASSTDTTLVPARIDGWWVRVDTLPRINTGRLTPIVCPAGNANAGKLGFTWRYPSAIAVGKHTATVNGWNFVIDSNGATTTTQQEGAAVSIPFTVVDPLHLTPPLAPANAAIRSS